MKKNRVSLLFLFKSPEIAVSVLHRERWRELIIGGSIAALGIKLLEFECDPQASSMGITWESAGKTVSRALYQNY